MRKSLTSLALILAVIGSVFPQAASGSPAAPEFVDFFVSRFDHFDVRSSAAAIAPSEAQVDAARLLVIEHPDVSLDWNPAFGTARTVLRHAGTLTEPAAGPAEDVARAWLERHAGLYGWTRADVARLAVVKSLQQPGNGPRYVLFHQVFGGLDGVSFGGSTVVALDDANRILSVRSNVVPTTALAGGAKLDEADALRIVSGLEAPKALGKRGRGYTAFAPGGFGGPHFVRRAAFPIPGAAARPALEVIFARRLDEGYRAAIDAVTGTVLYRHQLVAHQGAPEGRVFRNYPGAPDGGGEHELVSFAGDPDASPFGWTPGPVPASAGNNAHTGTNWTPAGIIAPDGNQLRAVGTFDVPFQDAWAESNCGENPVGSPQTPTYAIDTIPAIVNLFYHHNLSHDYWWKLGFTGPAGAMQAVNFEAPETTAELGHDPLLGLAQAAAVGGDLPPDDPLGRDNAYMFPNDDGLPQWSAQFLFQPIPPVPPTGGGFLAACVDGDFAADVIWHEYAHGVTSRWVGAEFGNLETIQGGSMGESWGDLYGTHYLHSQVGATGTNLASYDTGTRERSFRNFKIDEVTANYGDLGYDITGEEVHADGEIWNGVIWDLRAALMKALKDRGDYAMQIVADAMPTSGPSPSMLDMRNAILLADRARTKGKHQSLIWSVFARRGMGRSALSGKGDTAGGWDGAEIDPKGAFDHPDRARNATVKGRLVNAATGKPVAGARVIVGVFEARVTPLARTGKDGTFSFPIIAGSYPLTIQAEGHGVRRLRIKPKAGRTLSLRIPLDVNYASISTGAKVAETSNPSTLGPPRKALDDTQASVWWTDADDTAVGESFVVDLGGKGAVTLKRIHVSALRGTGGSRFEALKDFEVQASTNGKTFKTILKGTFSAPPPRPLVVDLLMRQLTLKKAVKATHLKFIGSPQDDWGGGLQMAELEAFGPGTTKITPQSTVVDPPFHAEGPVTVPGADANLTYNLMVNGACEYPPPTQGLDAYVFELPENFDDGFHLIDVHLEPSIPSDPRPDVDLYFLSANCVATGDIASTAPREAGTIPTGSKYVVALLYTAGPGTMILDAKDQA